MASAKKKMMKINQPIPNPMVVNALAEDEDDDLTMAGDEELHDYSEEEINGLWREKALRLNEQRLKNKERAYFLQLISWQNNRIAWEAFDSPYGAQFFQVDEPFIRVEEITLPTDTLHKQWVLNENWEWIETADDVLKKLKSDKKEYHMGGIIGVCQPAKTVKAVAAKGKK